MYDTTLKHRNAVLLRALCEAMSDVTSERRNGLCISAGNVFFLSMKTVVRIPEVLRNWLVPFAAEQTCGLELRFGTTNTLTRHQIARN